MNQYWQYQLPLWLIAFMFLFLLLIPMEVGFRVGIWRKRVGPKDRDTPRSDVAVNAMFALLGLMLAFTFAFTMGRADLRKQALLTEVNTLGTAFLRADLLPEPGRTKVRRQLFEYAKSRCVQPGTNMTLEELQQFLDRSEQQQSLIWPAVTESLEQPENVSGPERALIIASVNEVLDAHTRRLAVFWDRLPTAVLLLLLLIASVSIGLAAFQSSVVGHRPRWRMGSLALILASLMYVILDYDIAIRGLIQVDHSALFDLVNDMETEMGVK